MLRWLARRLGAGILVIWIAATAVFFLIRLAPGDPYLTLHLQGGRWTPDQLETARQRAGADRPLVIQYVRWIGALGRGDLGYSPHHRRPVSSIVASALPITLSITVSALLLDFLLGVAIAVYQARRPGSFGDQFLSVVSLMLAAIPIFWFGTLLIMVFSEWLGVLPSGGLRSAIASDAWSFWAAAVDRTRHTILPAATLGIVGGAVTARYQRSAIAEVLSLDYVRAAHARGLSASRVLIRHALRNALLPTITLAGLSLPFVVGGSVLVESVFGWQGGMGSIAARAVGDRDYDLIVALTLLASVMVILGNILADMLYRLADPRTRAGTPPR